jgi:hypothetical protein
LIKDPGLSWKKAAFTQYPRSGKSHRHRGHGDVMGYAIRTDSHRYVEWREWSNSKVVVRELYDHRTDADEMKNVASHKEHKAKVVELSRLLNAGWRASLPPGNSPSKPRN